SRRTALRRIEERQDVVDGVGELAGADQAVRVAVGRRARCVGAGRTSRRRRRAVEDEALDLRQVAGGELAVAVAVAEALCPRDMAREEHTAPNEQHANQTTLQ